MRAFLSLLILTAWVAPVHAQEQARRIEVFVALCDNASQGIAPVPERIGNGDDPDANLYWGCSDGLRSYFKSSSRWKLLSTEEAPSPDVLERLSFEHTDFPDVRLVAHAYRGSRIQRCMEQFFEASASDADGPDLVAFIGHNGLMDFSLEGPTAAASERNRDAIVLACKSQKYFADRLESAGLRPILLTEQLMYPGSFLLHAAIEGWLRGESTEAIRERAAKAYTTNQSISLRAARGVFSDLTEKD